MSKHDTSPGDKQKGACRESSSKERIRAPRKFDLPLLLPLESAANMERGNYARVHYDQHISDALVKHARGRAPDDSDQPDRDFRNHLLGVASEVAVATWRRGKIDNRILPAYEGDDGIDVIAPSPRGNDTHQYQVKATRDVSNPERVVGGGELEKSDYFVLCCTSAPSHYVEIVGYLSRPLLGLIGEAYGRDGYLLSPENLFPVKPAHYSPDDVRDVMYG